MNRQERGKQIAEKQDQIARIDESHYQVKSHSTKKMYDVIGMESGWICQCPDHQFRKVCCKHIHAVEISLRIRKEVKPKVVLDSVIVDCCIFCKSSDFKKAGIRKNKTHSIQVFQ